MMFIHHVGIAVSDYKRSLDFYCGALGLQILLEMAVEDNPTACQVFECGEHRFRMAMLGIPPELGSGTLELFEFRRPSQPAGKHSAWQPGWTHVCFATTDIDSTYQRLLANGIRFTTPPVELDATGITFVTPPKSPSLLPKRSLTTYFYDPDGAILELAQFG
jgi:catechol 2,3-dioxygenase-like lactoylglutathione lyase family enzyme